ncbi:uncharacterized Zn finger protein (UPF0148 family) [Filimonas zeae]|uniref:Uncharacterized protein n=1 Tax=Filimonas zeae TaxID=1737353 RepID=A0A917IPV4_9BACT|nr:hypothetical protein [Filimonas zeae]MDR6337665.1 uncharacterized Zn finger protein (UPF0148 family) [Filimonas zeae]GGH59690.1 hypothetical protein GCM10011379_06750 [Filimonas zeae]
MSQIANTGQSVPPSAPSANTPAVPQSQHNAGDGFNDQKQHYESLISLFKYCVTIIGLLITVFGGVVSYVVQTNGEDFKKELKEQRERQENSLNKMKDELEKEKDKLEKKSGDLVANIEFLKIRTEAKVDQTRSEALNELSNVKDIAAAEAKNRIEDVFVERNLDGYIVKVAKERYDEKVAKIVNEQFAAKRKELFSKLEHAVDDMNSEDKIIGRDAVATLTFNRSELNDDLLDKIGKQVLSGKVSDEMKPSVVGILASFKNEIVHEFFKSYLYSLKENLRKEPVAYPMAIRYLLDRHEANDIPFFERLVVDSKDNWLYTELLTEELQRKSGFLLFFLNSRKMVDHYHLVNTSDVIVQTKESFKRFLLEEKYHSTYFFKRQ